MPLIIMCGHPASGKTRRAERLVEALRERGAEVVLVNEASMGLCRERVYSGTAEEKKARSALKAAVERAISRRVTVVADSLNHIKGIRYELHCRAREASTPHCTVYCDTPPETCREWNEARPEGEDRYDEKAMDDLLGRMETPDGARRWDKPLFTVGPGDELPVDDVLRAVLEGKAPPQSFATVPQTLADPNALHELDRCTQEVVQAIMRGQARALPGDRLAVPHTDDRFLLSKRMSLAELRRLRRQFLKISPMGARATRAEAAASFVDYLNTNT